LFSAALATLDPPIKVEATNTPCVVKFPPRPSEMTKSQLKKFARKEQHRQAKAEKKAAAQASGTAERADPGDTAGW